MSQGVARPHFLQLTLVSAERECSLGGGEGFHLSCSELECRADERESDREFHCASCERSGWRQGALISSLR